MVSFEALPENCVAEIISHTTPKDAIRSSAISRGFKSAADSDTVWERFLPSDYQDIISISVSPVVNATKKQLYFRLCDFPILLQGGTKSFSLHKNSGKKCYMVGARELGIAWGDTPLYWVWISHPNSRFQEVAELRSVYWLDIRGKIETFKLSSKTKYAAYLVFKLTDRSYGFGSVQATIRFINHETNEEAERKAIPICLGSDSSRRNRGQKRLPPPCERTDEWMETELGEFYNDKGDDGEVEARLIEIKQLFGFWEVRTDC